jgi:ferredoxin-NADP reductase
VFEADGPDGLKVERLEYTAGQFVSFSADVEGKTITRAYSVASAPVPSLTGGALAGAVTAPDVSPGTNACRFELCLNRVEGGRLSPVLFAMQPGEFIEMRPPLGLFVLRTPPRNSLFVATGTGIAPFRAILQQHLNQSSPAITLLFGVRYESHLMYRAEFEEMASRFPQFRFWPTLSRPDENWKGRTGHVQAHLAEALGSRRDLDAYLCGLRQMVDDVRTILKGMGFDRKQIFYEKYD